jgi:2-oxoglutarate dehydrogenase E2 component (dihydrolipoamide succinyltransferase)
MDIRIPEVGESVRDALLAKWFKQHGELVKKDEALCEIETDKITLDINAEATGILSSQAAEGSTVAIGSVIGAIAEQVADTRAPTVSGGVEASPVQPADEGALPASSPAVRRQMREQGMTPDSVSGTGKGGRITLNDLSGSPSVAGATTSVTIPAATRPAPQAAGTAETFSQQPMSFATPPQSKAAVVSVSSEDTPEYNSSREVRKPMTPIRKRISERMVAARQQTAMLTTFNEADLGHVKELRARYREQFIKRHGAQLGLMPFFVKACVEALKEFPEVNASIDGDDLVYHNFYDIGVAIGAEKGLVVPVLRDADRMRLYEVDQAIAALSEKIKTNQLALSDLQGGTFTISNGGVYGSMLSTPILNLPQSGVLGMHAIQDRAVVRDGQIVIRPMMYLALSYDHRIIDGREAVNFLKKVKEYIEEPEELLLEG